MIETSSESSAARVGGERTGHVPLSTSEISSRIRNLIREADVIVGCFIPEIVGHLGLDHSVVRSINPKAVMGSVAASARQTSAGVSCSDRSEGAKAKVGSKVGDETTTARFAISAPAPGARCDLCGVAQARAHRTGPICRVVAVGSRGERPSS